MPYYYPIANLMLLCVGAWNCRPPITPPSSSPSTSASKIANLAHRLDQFAYILGVARKALRMAKKGVKHSSSALKSEHLISWACAPNTINLCIMAFGTLILVYQNNKGPKQHEPLGGYIKTFTWSLVTQSKKISDAHKLIKGFKQLIASPEKALWPLFFATLILIQSPSASQ